MIQREFLTIDIGALGSLDKGKVGERFEAALKEVVKTIQGGDVERSNGFAKGSINIKIDLAGKRIDEGGAINATVQVTSSTPKTIAAQAPLTLIGDALAFDVTPDAQTELPILRSVSK